jgi:hypothetical protein
VQYVDPSLHPILQEVLRLSSEDVLGSLAAQFSSHKEVAEALVYLCTSLITFVAPMLPHAQLRHFCSSLLICYVQPVAQAAPTATCEFVIELVEIVGGIVQYNRSKTLFQSTYGANCPAAIVTDLENLSVEAMTFACEGSSEVFAFLSNAIGLNASCDIDLSSMKWLQTRDRILHDQQNLCESLEISFRVLRSVFESARCLVSEVPSLLLSAVCAAVMSLPKIFDSTSLSLSAALLLQAMVSWVLDLVVA